MVTILAPPWHISLTASIRLPGAERGSPGLCCLSHTAHMSARPLGRQGATAKLVVTARDRCYRAGSDRRNELYTCSEARTNEWRAPRHEERDAAPGGSPPVPPQNSTAHVGRPSPRAAGDRAAPNRLVLALVSQNGLDGVDLYACFGSVFGL